MVEHWARTPSGTLSQKMLISTLSRSIWFQIQGFAGDLGIPITPNLELRDLLGVAGTFMSQREDD
jgi:hypothetical protein